MIWRCGASVGLWRTRFGCVDLLGIFGMLELGILQSGAPTETASSVCFSVYIASCITPLRRCEVTSLKRNTWSGGYVCCLCQMWSKKFLISSTWMLRGSLKFQSLGRYCLLMNCFRSAYIYLYGTRSSLPHARPKHTQVRSNSTADIVPQHILNTHCIALLSIFKK